MAFIGKGCGFSQRLLDGTDSPFCSDKIVQHSQRVVKGPTKLNRLREDVRSYDGPSPPKPVDKVLDEAIKLAFDSFSLPAPINPIHLNDFPRAEWDKWHTSPGLPWKNMGFKDKFSVAKDLKDYRWVRCYWHKIKDGHRKPPFDCDAYLDEIPEENKNVHVIWGYPATTAFQEACFAIPLNRECKKLTSPFMYDPVNIRDEVKNLYARFESQGELMSFEYVNFEKTVPAWLIRIAFDILLKNLDLTKYADRGIPDADKLLNAWKYAVYYFINTPIRLCNGERYQKRKGIPNGSSFAQLVGSIVNYIATSYALLKSGNNVKDMVVYSNSTLVCTSSPVNVEEFVSCLSKRGLSIDVSGIKLGNDIKAMTFLGYNITNEDLPMDLSTTCESSSSSDSQTSLDCGDSTSLKDHGCSVNDIPPCKHKSYRTNSLRSSHFNSRYSYGINTEYSMQYPPVCHPAYVAELNYMPYYYFTPVLLPLNVQY